jgi:hypothetical protein
MTCCKYYLNYNARTCDLGPDLIQQKKCLLSILPETNVIHICAPKCIMKEDR